MKKYIDSKKDFKRLTFEISPLKHKEIKTAAASLGITIKDFCDMSIKEFIEKGRTP